MPITRALRYKLLFKELLEKIPHDSNEREPIEIALLAANRLAMECDQKQGYDLDKLRRSEGCGLGRGFGGTAGKKSERAATMGRPRRPRPNSMGPLGMGSMGARAIRSSAS